MSCPCPQYYIPEEMKIITPQLIIVVALFVISNQNDFGTTLVRWDNPHSSITPWNKFVNDYFSFPYMLFSHFVCTEEHTCGMQDACGRGFNASVVCDAAGCPANMYTCTCPYGISKLPANNGKAVRCKGKSHFSTIFVRVFCMRSAG